MPSPADPTAEDERPVKVFISYAHDDADHQVLVQKLWVFLRTNGIDATFDMEAATRRQDWTLWMQREIGAADFVLVIASPEYKRRAEGDAGDDVGRGVQWEAQLLREELYQARTLAWSKLVPVVLPGRSAAEIPAWLGPTTATHYRVSDFSVAGAEKLLRYLTGQPDVVEAPLGPVPQLPVRLIGGIGSAAEAPAPAAPRPGLRTAVLITADVVEGRLRSAVEIGGAAAGQVESPVPESAAAARAARELVPTLAAERLAEIGRSMTTALVPVETASLLGALLDRLQPGDGIDMVLRGDDAALELPVELLRLPGAGGVDRGPLCLRAGVTICRELADAPMRSPASLPGPVKVLAAVAAPNETKTSNKPLDVEAEMQAVLDAAGSVAEVQHGEVQILEVASLKAIGDALTADAYHVLHLSAHGSATSVELEDEDGNPVAVTSSELIEELRHAGKAIPLIVLSACSGGSAGADSMALGLIRQGADRVLAMQAPITDSYATELAETFYRALVRTPTLPVARLLADARYEVAQRHTRDREAAHRPVEFWVPTLYCAAGDAGLVDEQQPRRPLHQPMEVPAGGSVRDLRMGELIGRRRELRDGAAVLRRLPRAIDEFGATGGVLLAGIGGIGKTAVAGRLIGRLRADGWLVAVHEGLWDPAQVLRRVGEVVTAHVNRHGEQEPYLTAEVAAALRDDQLDEQGRFELLGELIRRHRVLLVFDDFEQNLSAGGVDFLDPTVATTLAELADAAASASQGGALLITCRYPLPGDPVDLARIDLWPLSPSELRRLFLRLPALRELGAEDRAMLVRSIGGHPRLIEFVDALLRGGRSNQPHVKKRLRQLADRAGLSSAGASDVRGAITEAGQLGATDILLHGLLELLTPAETAILHQVAVSRAPMRPSDLAFALSGQPTPVSRELQAAIDRLVDLTLLVGGSEVVMHSWTADLVNAAMPPGQEHHEHALAMRWHRVKDSEVSYDDLIEIARHQAALGQYDDLADYAGQVVSVLPGVLSRTSFLAELLPLVPVTDRAWALLAELEFHSLVTVGSLQAAAERAAAMHRSIEGRAASDPGNTEWQRDLSVSHIKLGDLAQATGDLTAAQAAYQASLDIRARLAATDPTNTQWQRDLWVSHNKLGEIAQAAGDLAGARTAYQASLDITARLTKAHPTNTQWQRDLSISHNKLGDLARATGDLAGAQAAYQADLDITTRLAAADPANTEWQRDLAVSHDGLGSLAQATGDLTAAQAAYQASLNIRTRLTAADPANTEWQRDLAVSHDGLGSVAQATGDLTAAQAAYQASLNIRTRLTATDPTNTQWQRDLSISHNKLGDLARATGDLATARTNYQADLDIAARLATADPANAQWQRDLSISHERLGDLAQATGDLTTARTAYQASLDITARLAAADPANTQWQRDLSFVQERLSNLSPSQRQSRWWTFLTRRR